MKSTRVVLKEKQKLIDNKVSLQEYRKFCRDYGKKLESEGWTVCPIEGGCLSPDLSTIYIYHRDPYEGQLLNFLRDTEEDYKRICNDFIKSGDFINEEELWLEKNDNEKYLEI